MLVTLISSMSSLMYQWVSRRQVIATVTSALTLRVGMAQIAVAAETKVRMTMGLRAAVQSIPWIGTEAGIFRKHGLSVEFPSFEVGGPESAAGLIRGDWEFSQTGTVPIAEEVLKGNEPVILLRNALPHVTIFVMARPEFKNLKELDGRRVGVLTNATSGQAGINTRLAIERAGATATYVGLGTFDKIYAALAAGEIDAGAMPVDMRFRGETEHGWHVFPGAGLALPSIFATTRRQIIENRELVLSAVRGFVETVHLFKTRPDMVVPLLQRFMNFSDRRVAEALHAFYVPLFPSVPRPDLADGMKALRDLFAARYPAAANLQETDIADVSIIDEVARSGFIDRLSVSTAR
jgi:ABC-type nitrate/sulfonate/bicarbonate transport system substrate-binding protein